MKSSEQPTIAIVVTRTGGEPVLTETLTSAEEILELEMALIDRDPEPLKRVYSFRDRQKGEEEDFADFVEGILSQPFLKPEVQEHAVQWFKSRTKIETYQKAEYEASRVIAQYAFQVFSGDPRKTDFMLAGPKARVRIRVIDLSVYDASSAA
jgi:hypothetical protein